MAPSKEAIDVLGGVGGALLAASLAPQLIKLVLTKSAFDLSYLFLWMYNAGLVLTLVYLYYEDAVVSCLLLCLCTA